MKVLNIKRYRLLILILVFTGIFYCINMNETNNVALAKYKANNSYLRQLAAEVISDEVTEDTTNPITEPDVVSGKNLYMKIECGYERYIKYGRNMPVNVEITNSGEDFTGYLQIITPNQQLGNVMYEKEIALPSGTTKNVSIPIPVMSNSDKIRVQILNSNEKTVLMTDTKLNINQNMRQIFIGILSDDYNSLNYMANDETKLFSLTEDTFAEDYASLELLDIIIINDFNSSKLNENQYSALKTWVLQGGTLIIGTGVHYQKSLELFQDDFITGTIGNLTTGEVMIEQSIIKKEILDIKMDNSNQLPYTYANQFQTGEVSNIELNYNTLSDVFKLINIGKGNVILSTIDIGLDKNNRTAGGYIYNTFIQNLSIYKQQQLMNDLNYYNNESWQLSNILSSYDLDRIPNIFLYCILLFGYIIIVGPILYIVLKKRDKSSYTWAFVPAIAVIASCLVLVLGNKTRISEPFVNYANIITLNNNVAQEERYFNITAPSNKKYSFSLSDRYSLKNLGNLRNYGYYYYYGESVEVSDYKMAFKYRANETQIEMKNFSAFSEFFFESNDTYTITGGIDGDLRYTKDGLSGTVTNNLSYDLESASIFAGGLLINLGNINAGDSISVDDKESMVVMGESSLRNGSGIYSNIIGTNVVVTSTSQRVYNDKKTEFLTYFLTKRMGSGSDKIIFSGFVKDYTESNFEKDMDYETKGINLITAELDTNNNTGDKVYIPSIISYVAAMQYVDTYNKYLYEDNAFIDYDFGANEKILEIYYEEGKNKKFNTYDYEGFLGVIEFFNYQTNNFEEVFINSDTVSDISKYLDDNNTLKVRFIKDSSYQGYGMTIPVLSALKEVR